MSDDPSPDPRIFISYSHADLAQAKSIEAKLRAGNVNVWRDQDKLQAGELWPKVLGETISRYDAILLIWSKHASESHFVELEWCTGIALKTTILPYCLDNTPLPAALSAVHAIKAGPRTSTQDILRIFGTQTSQSDPARTAEVLSVLDSFESGDSKQVLDEVKNIFEQKQWTVEGDVYQAGRDIHVTNIHSENSKDTRSFTAEWGSRVALVAGVLAIIGWFLDLPGKIGLITGDDDDEPHCELTVGLTSLTDESLGNGILSIMKDTDKARYPIPVGGRVVVNLTGKFADGWTPVIVWPDGSRSSFQTQLECPQSYQGKSDDDRVEISIVAN